MYLEWNFDDGSINWQELSQLYNVAPLGKKDPAKLQIVFSHSMFKCFVSCENRLVGVGRALADGTDCSYICDVAVHPDFQGKGIGKEIVLKLVAFSEGHKKIILYANPGKEKFYEKLGFKLMATAMAIFENQEQMLQYGVLKP